MTPSISTKWSSSCKEYIVSRGTATLSPVVRTRLPSIRRVIRTRDVVFVRSKLYNSQSQYAEKSYVQEAAELLDIEETPDYSNMLTEQLSSHKENAEEIGDTIHV